MAERTVPVPVPVPVSLVARVTQWAHLSPWPGFPRLYPILFLCFLARKPLRHPAGNWHRISWKSDISRCRLFLILFF